jgi:hypothetical protein
MQLVELCSFDNYVSAYITLGMLQDAGINCHLKDEYTLTIDPLLVPALGGIKIMVPETQYQLAGELLAQKERPDAL